VRPPKPDAAGDLVSGTSIVNIANFLTLLRIACVPIMVVLLFAEDGHDLTFRWWAAGVFVFAALTDLVDGAIARRRGLVTNFGKIADPIADKALIGAALVSLSVLADLAWWVTIVILVRELGITVLRFWVIEHGVIPASRGGKAKTVAQGVAITMYLLEVPDLPWWSTASMLMMAVAVVLTVITGIDYVVRAVRLRAKSKANLSEANS
jgi:CDP-diacylglycerol---glycerol-3-phosphate 3-phosphatidyltransferase